ncbi:MAG: phosphoglycerate kinase [Candidatus Methanospirareceae archaeon]
MLDDYLTLDDFELYDKTILLRTDINSEVINGEVRMSDKIEEHAKTMKELSERGAKTVVISHQGRAGGDDFVSLEQHTSLLGKFVDIKYIDDIIGPAARESIRRLKRGEILLLENVRFLAEETLKRSPEEHAKSFFIRKLAPLVDIYINDAFEAVHRAHASIVGFPVVLPAGIGRIMQKELESLKRVAVCIQKPCVYVLGGAKYEDILPLIEHLLKKKKADYIITTGNVANLFLCARGILDKRFFDGKYVDRAERIIKSAGDRIKVPKDVAIDNEGKREEISVEDVKPEQAIYDIGSETAEEYSSLLKEAKTTIMKGPAGVYEREEFMEGTKRLFEAIANSSAFSLIAGGNTTSALKTVGLSKKQFSHISLAGGALLKYLMEEELPGLEVLKRKQNPSSLKKL